MCRKIIPATLSAVLPTLLLFTSLEEVIMKICFYTFTWSSILLLLLQKISFYHTHTHKNTKIPQNLLNSINSGLRIWSKKKKYLLSGLHKNASGIWLIRYSANSAQIIGTLLVLVFISSERVLKGISQNGDYRFFQPRLRCVLDV